MADQELKCKDCGKEASKDSNFHKSSLLCNACSSKRWRAAQKKKKGAVTPSKSQAKRVAAQKGEALTTKPKDICVDCGIAASEASIFNYKHQVCSKCRQKRYYKKGQSGKVPKTRRGKGKKATAKAEVPMEIPILPSLEKEDTICDFIDSQGLSFLEGSVVSRICNYHRKGSFEDLQEAFYHLSVIVGKEVKKRGGKLVIKE